MTKKKPKLIKVPALPELARRLDEVNHNFKVVWSEEYTVWCTRYADYFVAVGKDKPDGPYMAWHNRASKLAREKSETAA